LYTFSGKIKEEKYGKRKCSKNVDIFDLFNFTFVVYTAAGLASSRDGFDTQISLRGAKIDFAKNIGQIFHEKFKNY
jgi:hypothetical protein